MTRRSRMEQRAAKREEWAASAESKAARHFAAADSAVDGIPPGQPVLVGHHSERRHRAALKRCDSNMRAGVERIDMAHHHESVAATLQDRLESNIFSDDVDAIQALEARIAEREAERDRIKRYNATCRAAAKRGESHGDLSLLDIKQRADLETLARVASYQLRDGGAFPAYVLSNLSGRIKADRDRVESVRRQQERQASAEQAGGVSVKRHPDVNWCIVTFAEKPERSVLDALRAAGYRWGGGSWQGYLDKLPEGIVKLESEVERIERVEVGVIA